MTMWAKRADTGDSVEVHVTHGPVAIVLTESRINLRHFWGQLGVLLEDVSRETKPGDVSRETNDGETIRHSEAESIASWVEPGQ